MHNVFGCLIGVIPMSNDDCTIVGPAAKLQSVKHESARPVINGSRLDLSTYLIYLINLK